MSREYDISTIEVTQWLKYYNIPFVRINGEDKFKIKKIALDDERSFIIYNEQGKEIALHEIKSVWYRRGQLNIYYPFENDISSGIIQSIKLHLTDEINILEKYFYFLMAHIPHLGKFATRSMNKLEVLFKAQHLGIKIPQTYIFDAFNSLNHTHNTITKCISEPFTPVTPYGRYMTYTEDITHRENTQSHFFPSLFQEKYEKEADLRIFYMDGNFYSMAIRSQSDAQTATDFRKYLNINPNRKFPFRIPETLKVQLKKLMDAVSLETGSIDMIFTKKGEFVFLEVNPVGQFGMTSYPCNYYLEKEIALHLTKIAQYEQVLSN